MATDKATTPEITWTDITEDVEEMTKVVLQIGDRFTAQYTEQRTMPGDNGTYVQFRFLGGDGQKYFINPGYQLRESWKRVRPTNLVRVTMLDERSTGRESMMGIYQVEVAKLPQGASLPTPVIEYADMTAKTEPPF